MSEENTPKVLVVNSPEELAQVLCKLDEGADQANYGQMREILSDLAHLCATNSSVMKTFSGYVTEKAKEEMQSQIAIAQVQQKKPASRPEGQ